MSALVHGWISVVWNWTHLFALVLAGGAGWDGELDAAIVIVLFGLMLLRLGYLLFEQLSGLLGGVEVVVYFS